MTKTTYTLLGAGGTGSILFPNLLRYLETYHRARKESFYIQVIDGDDIEPHNLDRQLFTETAIGANKAEALIQTSPFIPPSGKLFSRPEFIGKDNVKKVLRDGDIVIIAADNYSIRALIEEVGKTLDNLVVINGGNESTDGSCQLWVRVAGRNVTPPLSHCHPEIVYKGKDDRAAMSCEARSKLAGGEQTIVANMMSAVAILNMLRLYHSSPKGVPPKGHEVHFDLNTLAMRPDDWRGVEGWTS